MPELITENVDFESSEIESELVTEGMVKTKVYYIKGPYLQAECINGNKRTYPKSVIEREVERYNKVISEKRSVGEFEHSNTSAINMERVSHLITSLQMEGNTALGKAKVLDRPEFKYGQIVKAMIEEGIKFGISSRGTGTLKNGIVQNDFSLSTCDCVWNPSGPGCWMDGILESKTEWVMENGILTEKEITVIKSEVDQIIVENKFSLVDRQAALTKLFSDTMNKIASKSRK